MLKSSKVVSRSATFVFFIGDRFFGTVTGYVRGQEAEKYDFTSALAAEVLKALEPELRPLIQEELESAMKPPSQVSCLAEEADISVSELVLSEVNPASTVPPQTPLLAVSAENVQGAD